MEKLETEDFYKWSNLKEKAMQPNYKQSEWFVSDYIQINIYQSCIQNKLNEIEKICLERHIAAQKTQNNMEEIKNDGKEYKV